MGVPIIRTMGYSGLYWGPLILGNYYIQWRPNLTEIVYCCCGSLSTGLSAKLLLQLLILATCANTSLIDVRRWLGHQVSVVASPEMDCTNAGGLWRAGALAANMPYVVPRTTFNSEAFSVQLFVCPPTEAGLMKGKCI